MYYRYKSKRGNKKFIKVIAILALISCPLYFGYRNRDVLLFWKQNLSKLDRMINKVDTIKNPESRLAYLLELKKFCTEYKEENYLDMEAFYMSGRVHFLLGESYSQGSFSTMLIYDRLNGMDPNAAGEFIQSIKDIQKGIALEKDASLNNSHMVLARAKFYTRHSGYAEIYALVKDIEKAGVKLTIEDARFLAAMHVLNDNVEQGMALLKRYERSSNDVEGMLFAAALSQRGRRYTNAIIQYKEIINKTKDPAIVKQVYSSLGKIYFNQSLFNESLVCFDQALKIDEKDYLLKIWIGKNYSALGNKIKARSILTEVLAVDTGNEEAKQLLGSL